MSTCWRVTETVHSNTGVTGDLVRRIYEHKGKFVRGFTRRYGVDRLVWFESYDAPENAIEREKELKKWRRRGSCG